ncbi:MAG: endonuclease [Bacteroidaceae bacterium]|nr:endonuclease [Bacteroidaceae bacterium]
MAFRIAYRHSVVFLLVQMLFGLPLSAQQRFRVMTYNVENLFDVKHDSLKNDYEFLPTSKLNWTKRRYWDKLDKIAKVIAAVGEGQLPELVGLCEVENDTCLYDLTRRSSLRRAGYRYVMTNSGDERGIDVALLYLPARFKVIEVERINVKPEVIKKKPTRDILHVTGLLQSKDTLDVYVCHMPSRNGGKEKSQAFRIHTNKKLRESVDAMLQRRKVPRILIMGDFNDYPKDKSLSVILDARKWDRRQTDKNALYNLCYDVKPGSYRYQGYWNTLDQIIVNGRLLPATAQVFMAKWLLTKDKTHGGEKPFRTYQGPLYLGGYSDHLPVYADLPLNYSW